jgi:hypothetical protein
MADAGQDVPPQDALLAYLIVLERNELLRNGTVGRRWSDEARRYGDSGSPRGGVRSAVRLCAGGYGE